MDREEFNNYVTVTARQLYLIAFRILKEQSAAEDAVQEIFIKLWKMVDSLHAYDSITAMATTMLKNYCIDQLRKKRFIILDDTGLAVRAVSDAISSDVMEKEESAQILDKIISAMPENYRKIIEMHDIEGLPYDEIAAKTGQNINSLRVTESRARNYLKNEYSKYFNEKRGIRKTAGEVL